MKADARSQLLELVKTLPKHARVKDLIGIDTVKEKHEPRGEPAAGPYALDASR